MPSSPQLPPGPRRPFPGAMLMRLRRVGMLNLLRDLAREFGDLAFFRLGGRPFCLVTEPELIRKILVTDNAHFTKSHALASVKKALGDGLLTADGDTHKKHRRMIGPVFHAQQVKAYGEDFVAQARRMADAWQDGQTLDVGRAMTELTLRVVTKSLFDTELDDDVRTIGQDMETVVTMFERIRNPLRFLLDRLPLPSNKRYNAAMGRIDARLAEMIDARRTEAEQNPDAAHRRFDLLSLLLTARDDAGAGMSANRSATRPSPSSWPGTKRRPTR
ncbi:MAG: cytochrome P450 [Tepidisphaeraceae bacterium]